MRLFQDTNTVPHTAIFCSAALSIVLLISGAAGQKQNAALAPQATALFEAKVRPLLLSSCVGCHGKENPGGGLHLDAPVSPEMAQEIVRRIKGEGGKPRMPLGSTLATDKIAALEQWVKEGAVWPASSAAPASSLMEKGKTHWAFQPLKRPAVPKVKAAKWIKNPIDAFILNRLEAKGFQPSPPASRRELIRRVTYDLIGLPPTPEEVAAFEADKSTNAYEKLVDRLLASPHYGEKWGRHWLDLVRYAETNSYERDNPKPNIYKYRDYVIRAFNEDKPYDRFVREQLAGDELPNPTTDDLEATAYYRLGIWDDEPADMKQAEFDDLDDLVATTGQAFLGLTLDCARCHDHKLDPIPQKDYYRFAAFFHNINRFRNGGPTDEAVAFANDEQKKEFARKAAELDARRKENQTELATLEAGLHAQHAKIANANDLADLRFRYFEGAWDHIPDFDKLKAAKTGVLAPAFLDIRARKRDENFGFVFEGFVNVPQEGEYTFYLDTDDGSRLTIAGQKLLEKDSNGGQGMERNGKLHLAAGRVPFRVDYFQGGGPFGVSFAWSGPGFARRPLSTFESSGPSGLPLLIGPDAAAQYTKLLKEKSDLAAQEPSGDKVLCVTETGPKPSDTFVMLRGNPNAPGEKVEAGFPICAGGGDAVIPPLPPSAKSSGRRTALANWLVSPENPLTARVIVNRIWQHHFGRGLVRTPNDFGLTGARPTHPGLLDWLAKEFIAQGWSFKKLHRLILTSSTYRQSSQANPAELAKDPQNDLFWRFDMRRLTAEEIRDSLLAVAGNINLDMYGEPIYPEIPKDILAAQSRPGADWNTDKMKPGDENRRSIYIHVKRSLIYPMLGVFDLPETDRPSSFRFASTQPTQALGLLNSPLANKQAAVLADRVRKEIGNEERAFTRRLLSLVLQRVPTEKETAEGVDLLNRLKKRGAKPEQAQTYLALMALNLDEFIYLD